MSLTAPLANDPSVDRGGFRVAIIGCGPRGLRALEHLCAAAIESGCDRELSVTVLESHDTPGAGPNYDPRQPNTNLLNVPQRDLHLDGRPEHRRSQFAVPGFPSWTEWLRTRALEVDVNAFAPRPLLGEYLAERFDRLATSADLPLHLKLVKTQVIACEREAERWRVVHTDGDALFDKVLMTIGHQPAEMDEEVESFEACPSVVVHPSVYPVTNLIEDARIGVDSNVLIRGFGLSFLDATRALTEGRGGVFQEASDHAALHYVSSGSEPKCIVPYSLDGLPPVPKPATKQLDDRFRPSADHIERLNAVIHRICDDCKVDAWELTEPLYIEMCGAVAESIHRTASGSSTQEPAVFENSMRTWLAAVVAGEQPQSTLPVQQAIQAYIEMSIGERIPSIDYVAGQVWRHVQAHLYAGLSDIDDEPTRTASRLKQLIKFDETIQRYSYGPPVIQMQRLCALVEQGLVSLKYLKEPQIAIRNGGCVVSQGDARIHIDAFANSVLAGPSPSQQRSPLIDQLLNDSHALPLGKSLGVTPRARADGESITIIGRLTTGVTLGNDSIHRAMSDESLPWAAATLSKVARR